MKWWVEIILGEDYHILQNLQLAWLGFSKNHPKFWGTEKTNGFTLKSTIMFFNGGSFLDDDKPLLEKWWNS